MKNVVVLSVDGWQQAYAGCYGNTWINTPELDRLASEAFVADFAMMGGVKLDDTAQAWWAGRSAAWGNTGGGTIMQALREQGVETVLLSDDAAMIEHPLAAHFQRLQPCHQPPPVTNAETVEQTQLAQFFTQAVEIGAELQQTGEPYCLWLHTASLNQAWDAPLDYRLPYLDDSDDELPKFFLPPCVKLPENYDPDQRLAYRRAYAGQVAVLDECVGAWLEELRELPAEEVPLVLVCGAGGFPLGEHLRVGAIDDALYGERIHFPLLVRFPDLTAAATRSRALIQSSDLAPTLAAYFELPADTLSGDGLNLLPLIHGEQESLRDRVLISSPTARALRTPAWYYCEPHDQPSELYVKPEDRWEVNEVSNRCQDLVPLFASALNSSFALLSQSVSPRQWPPLEGALLEGLD